MSKIKITKKKVNRTLLSIFMISILTFAYIKVPLNINAEEDIFYASDFVNDPNGGYLNVTFEYGSYPQSKVTDLTLINTLNGITLDTNDVVSNGDDRYKKIDEDYYKFEPIKWRILSIDEDNDEVFVLSEKVLDSHEWDDQYVTMYTWDGKNYEDDTDTSTDNPTIRKWLNEEFYNTAFTFSEQGTIKAKEYETYNDDMWESYDGTKTLDKITLLSSLETVVARDGQDMATKYGFDSNYYYEDYYSNEIYSEETNRLGVMTDYALVNYNSDYPYTINIDNSINKGKKTGDWWTRSRSDAYYAFKVDYEGYAYGSSRINFISGVRPALSFKFSSLKEKVIKMNYGLRGSYTFEGYSCDDSEITELTLKDIKNLKVYFSNEKKIDNNEKTLTTWYANAIDDNKNHGYINLGTYPKTKVRDNYLISELKNAYNDPEVVKDSNGYFTYGYNKYVKKDNDFYQVEPITWQVLKFNDDGFALLLSKDVIDAKPWDNQSSSNNKWDNTSNPPLLRTWLNDESDPNSFISTAFTSNEQDLIKNYNYKIYDNEDGAGETVQDKVTLLSNYETCEIKAHEIGFASDYDRIGLSSGRIGHGTDYALSNYRVNDMSLPLLTSMTYSGNSMAWWTRSRFVAPAAYEVFSDGTVNISTEVDNYNGVRPALSLKLSSLTGIDGEGTIGNPYNIGKYKIDVVSNGGGTITPCNDYFVEGKHIELEAIPNDGFEFDGWYEDNTILTSELSYEFDVSSNRNIEARFKPVNNKTITNFTKGNGYVSFGSYPQSKVDPVNEATLITELDLIVDDDSDGYIEKDGVKYKKVGDTSPFNYYKVEPITWQVLDVENTSDGKTNLLLFSNKILESMTSNRVLWSPKNIESSDNIRIFLNTEFITNAFSDEEKGKIATSNVEAYDEMCDGIDTTDKVFLLSVGELTGVMNIGDKYGFAPEAWTAGDESNRTSGISDYAKVDYDSSPIDGDTYSYWLRDFNAENGNHFYVNNLGQTHSYYEDTTFSWDWVFLISMSDVTSSIGVKPALRVILDNSYIVNGGQGTLDSPYTLGEVKYTVSFNPNGGSGTMNDVSLNSGDTFTIPNCVFTKSGYTFDCWTIDGVKVTSDTITINSDIELKANWKSTSSGGSSKRKKTDTKEEPKQEEEIKPTLYDKKYMKGYEDKTFRSDNSITRAELATVFSRLLNDNIDNENYTNKISIYNDLELSWYKNYIGYLITKDVFEGYGDGTFKPQNNMTRAEFAKCIVKMYNLKLNNSNVIDNKIIEGKWYKNYIDIMSSNGYIDDLYVSSCDSPITRKEVCKIVNTVTERKAKTKDTLTSEEAKYIQDNFKDLNENDAYYYDIVTALLG